MNLKFQPQIAMKTITSILFWPQSKAYAHHHKLKARANQTKPHSASHSSYSMDKTKKKKKKRQHRKGRQKKGKIFKNKKNDYLYFSTDWYFTLE